MRSVVVAVLALGMLGALFYFIVTREQPVRAPEAIDPSLFSPDGGIIVVDAGASSDASVDPDASLDGAPSVPTIIDRPVRVVGLGWDLITPAVVANRGLSPDPTSAFAAAGLPMHFQVTGTISGVEAMLATGGAEENGADIAIVPLPAFAVAYERIRALDPQVFFVIAWSRGRHAIYGRPDEELRDLTSRSRPSVLSDRAEAAAYFVAFMFQLAGVSPENIRYVPEDDPTAANAEFAAIDFGMETADARSQGRRVLTTTNDATHLIPYVAIAPSAFLSEHADVAAKWASVWLEAIETMRSDVPASARMVAGLEGAPEAVALLRWLGQLEFIDLGNNARLLGLSGRGALTIDALFSDSWRLLRESGAITTPRPEVVPLAEETVLALVRSNPTQVPLSPGRIEADFTTELLIRTSVGDEDPADATLQRIGFLAGVFERSGIRLEMPGRDEERAQFVTTICERYDLRPQRFQIADGSSRGGVRVEVLSPP